MERTQKISVYQFFALLMLSRLLSTLTFVPMFREETQGIDYIIVPAIMCVFLLVFAIPIYFLLKKGDTRSLMDAAYRVSPVFSKMIAVLYAVFFILYCMPTLARLDLFAETIVFPESNNTDLFILLAVVAVCYAAYQGLEAIGRAGTLSLGVLLLTFAVIFIVMAGKMDITNFTPPFYKGVKPVLQSAWVSTYQTTELIIAATLLPRVKGNTRKGFFAWLFLTMALISLIFVFVVGGLGRFAFSQLFPVHTIAVLSEFSLLERLDVLLTGVWILSAFIKLSLMLYLQSDLLSRAFKPEWRKYYILLAGALLFAMGIYISRDITRFPASPSSATNGILFAVFTLLLPIGILIAEKIKRRKENA